MIKRASILALWLMLAAVSVSGCGAISNLLGGGADETPAPSATAVPQATATEEPVAATAKPTSAPTATPVPPTDTPQPAPTEEPTATPEPTEEALPEPTEEPTEEPRATPEVTEESLFTDVSSLAELPSYRYSANLIWDSEAEGSESGEMTILMEYQAEPPAQHMIITSSNLEDTEDSTLEMILIEGDLYMCFGDEEWLAMTGSDTDNLFENAGLGWMGNMEAVVGDSEPEYLGQEKIEGLLADHYSFDADALSASGWTGDLGVSEASQAQMDLWVSLDYNVPIKTLLVVDETTDGEATRVSMEATLSDIGEDLNIQPPEGVGAPGLPEDIPVMEGASNLTVMMGIATYEIETPVQEATDWYLDAMRENGWTYSEDSSMPPMFMGFTKEGREVSLMLSQEEAVTTVAIMFGEEED